MSGPSGAGKTTLLRILCGLDKEYDGACELTSDTEFSYCFQEYRLFPQINALKNILLVSYEKAGEAEADESRKMLARLSFTDGDMELLPSQLSGGMKQRVAFARAVLKKTNVLLLDEPTKEVDERVADEMLKIISEESQKRLVILVTHKSEDVSSLNSTIVNIGARN